MGNIKYKLDNLKRNKKVVTVVEMPLEDYEWAVKTISSLDNENENLKAELNEAMKK